MSFSLKRGRSAGKGTWYRFSKAIAKGLDNEIAALRASADAYENEEEFERVVAARAQLGYADRVYEQRRRDARRGPLAR